ncbi:MAG: hypothetical protein A2451_01175, partial [Bdellovibrionales bacterium RIFOXYC2_FULL_39_8]
MSIINSQLPYKKALVIGGGAFGTSIAAVLANKFEEVIIKVRDENLCTSINQNRENQKYLPGKKLSENLRAATKWSELLPEFREQVEIIIFALPTTAITEFLYDNFFELGKFLEKGIPIVSLAKGIDPATLEFPDDLYFNYFPEYSDQFLFLSGPSFANEIMDEHITVVSLAGRSKRDLEKVADMLHTNYFKVLTSYDVKGVLLGGALKNVLAIAAGIIQGLGYNHNTRAAMLTRGIAEMLRFGKVFNARPETFYGLSGMGDLILSTTGDLSRNKKFGIEIAKGRTAQQILNEDGYLVEG